MPVRPECEVDFSDSDFLVSQLQGKARLSQLRKKKAVTPATAPLAEAAEPPAESAGAAWRPVIGKLLVLIPLVLLAWFLLASW